jgi:hypothetical protein
MNNSQSMLDAWLAGLSLSANNEQRTWDPGFDGDRHVVLCKLGPYRKLFERPQHFIPRFFHHVYPLRVEEWQLNCETHLYGGFCLMTIDLQLHFQATFKYAQRNINALPELNLQIKTSYEGLIKDIVKTELRALQDGMWLETGLATMERQIESALNEALILKHIQCRSLCILKPVFTELSDSPELDDRFTQSSIYLKVIQKHFEFLETQRQERFREEEALELQQLAHKQKQLDLINREAELHRQKQALEAEAIKKLLEEQEVQRIEQYAIEARLHREKTNHDLHLKEIEHTTEIQYKNDQQLRQQQLELHLQARQFEHNRMLEEQERQAQLHKHEQQQTQWLKKIEHEQHLKQLELDTELKEQERYQLAQQQMQERLETEKIKHQSRLYEMQLNAELKTLELRAEATQNKDEYLRREIEWLVLEKQRAELTRAIKLANPQDEGSKEKR